VTRPKLAILVSFSGQGGVERMIANLCQALVDAPIDLDVLLIKAQGPYVDRLPDAANIISLRARHSLTSVWEVARYLKRERPDALLAIKHRGILAALRARQLARTDTPISGRIGTTVSAALANKSSRRRQRWYRAMCKHYPKLEKLIAVSQGVAEDVLDITGMNESRVTVVRNPTVTPDMLMAATEPVEHPWLSPDNLVPVIMGVGRLTEQKDFDTLIAAFAKVRSQQEARLIILGDGGLRSELIAQVTALGVDKHVALPGFQSNPWAWMSKASVFALSSRWEGSPNTLTEAMALGIPVVSTDCPSGPRELLDAGRFAPLVAMGDSDALANALLWVLAKPPQSQMLTEAVSAYHRDVSAAAYLQTLGLSA
jgi:glycosyltransferase involved in cell wall biosynthesis